LILFAFGSGYALSYQAEPDLQRVMMYAGAPVQEFDLEGLATYVAPEKDGLYVGAIELHPLEQAEGGIAVDLVINDLRPATAEEWARHRKGEWPWD
jgi:hypothetical protein